MTHTDRRVVGLLATAHAMVHIFEQAFPALLGLLMVQFAFSLQAGGYMQFGLALAFGVGAIPGGMLASRWGARRVVQVYLLLASAGACLMAFATDTTMLTLGLLGIGAGISLYHPAGTSFVATNVRARSQALGYHGMGGGFGVCIGPALTVTLAALVSWRVTLGAYAVMGLGLAALLRRLPESGVHDVAHAPEADDRPRAPEETGNATRLSLLLFAAVLVGFVYRGALTFLPLYLGRRLAGDSSPERAAAIGGYIVTGALTIGMGAQWLGGQLGARYSPTRLFALGHMASVPCLLLLATADGVLLVVAAALFAFGHFLAQPLGNALVAEYTSVANRERAFGWYFALAFGLGAFASSIGGEVGARYALESIFLLLSAVAAVACAAAWWLHVLARAPGTRIPQPVER